MNPVPPAPRAPTLREALLYWLKLGFISFGGPAGQIALMHDDLVVRKRWISDQRFMHALNYCMVLPGPEAQQLATYIGWLMHRTWGGLIAGCLFVLPSLLILITLSWLYMAFGKVAPVAAVLWGIKPAVTAIVVSAAWRIGAKALKNAWLWAIALGAFTALFVFNLPFPIIVLSAGAVGYLGGRFNPGRFNVASTHAKGTHSPGQSVIDDNTPTPPHALFTWARFWRVAIVCVGLWAVAMLCLMVTVGWDATLTQMAWFFTKAALMTFGGAYAVLPYVYQGAVDHFHWLTAPQMMDGLALGETTPGPLIMVVSFVGFAGGWTVALFGPDALLLAGVVAATVVTFFTFLPSFFFIFLGGPFIESTHGNLKFTAPLTGITAAVVGVIVNLAAFFGYHVLWPQGFSGSFDWPSAVLGFAAAVALIRFKVGVITVVLASGLAGLALMLVR